MVRIKFFNDFTVFSVLFAKGASLEKKSHEAIFHQIKSNQIILYKLENTYAAMT